MHARIKKNFRRFSRLVDAAQRATAPEVKAQRCAQAALFATHHPCGILYSCALETMLQEVAQTIPVCTHEPFSQGRFLHVMTRSYLSGGHTRVVERWIDASPANQRHDVVLISQGKRPVPRLLEKVAQQKNGEVFQLSEGMVCEKARELRAIAGRYEAVILHTHQYDVVPVVAFASEEFRRPVILFNHCDHLFWVGASISDLVVNFRTTTLELGRQARTIQEDAVLPLPMVALPDKQFIQSESATAIKASLGFPSDSKVIVTVASAYKYKAVAGFDFLATIQEILSREPKAVLLAIGPTEQEPEWRKLREMTSGRVRAIGIVPASELDRYLFIADVALESFPVNSPTALMEIARYKIPCLTLRTPAESVDPFIEAGIVCNDIEDLIVRTVSMLHQPQGAEVLYSILQRDALPDGFSKKLAELYASFPVQHQFRQPLPDPVRSISDLEYFIAENNFAQPFTWRSFALGMARRLMTLYVNSFYPIGLTSRHYNYLNSFGLL